MAVFVCPRYMVGSARRFDEKGIPEKLKEMAGYVVSDIERFPAVP
jgi:hypothetical protein